MMRDRRSHAGPEESPGTRSPGPAIADLRGIILKIRLYTVSYLGIWYDGPALGFEEIVQRAKDCGYDGIELETALGAIDIQGLENLHKFGSASTPPEPIRRSRDGRDLVRWHTLPIPALGAEFQEFTSDEVE
jgi:hypothetical protein